MNTVTGFRFATKLILIAVILQVGGCDQKNRKSTREVEAKSEDIVLRQSRLESPAEIEGSHGKLFSKIAPEVSGIQARYQWNPPDEFLMQLNSYACTAGVAIGDYDNDGLPDIYVANQTDGGRLYRNLGGFRFEDTTDRSGVTAKGMWGTGVTFADIDNDQDLDLYVCGFSCPNRLYVNNGDGTFIERAASFGLDYCGASTMMSFADYDRDGDLDAYLLTNRLPPKRHLRARARKINGKIVIPKELQEFTNVMETPNGEIHVVEAAQFDYFFRNNGDGTFTDVSDQVGVGGRPYHGLSALWWDHNQDGWPDLYISNDFTGPDHFYEHNADRVNPAFVDRTKAALPHLPWFSMGADFGDVNNDGMLDLIATDMSPTTHYRSKLTMGDMSDFAWFLDAADPPQYMRNALFLNTGTGRFFEAAYLAGVANSGWTWSVRMADLDCDGRQDLLMTTGMSRDFENTDYSIELQRRQQGISPTDLQELRRVAYEFWRDKPTHAEPNLAFRNEGNLQFKPVHSEWGIGELTVSSGCATGDLDGDGDLDLVVNNFDQPPGVYRNESDIDSGSANRVKIQLQGTRSNAFGIGSRIEIETKQGRQIRYLTLARGYMSSSEPTVFLGLGRAKKIDRLTITWSSGIEQQFRDLDVNTTYIVRENDSDIEKQAPAESSPKAWFVPSDYARGVRHRERPYNDFERQPLLPNRLSQLGPGLAWGDINGDDVPDMFLGGAAGEIGRPHTSAKNGFRIFPKWLQPFFDDVSREDMGVLLFDADCDGDRDLYVVSGGVECDPESELLKDRLYLNEGQGKFSHASKNVLPDTRDSGSCVAAADFDRDGDLDLFVGGRVVPGQYPTTPASRLYRNDSTAAGPQFTDVTNEVAPALLTTGMVTSAIWSDVDDDGWIDLMATHEWGPVKFFRNVKGRLEDQTAPSGLADRPGWFNGIAGGDVDGDGDIDYVVTNFGQNTKYHASPEQPLHLFYGDLDGTGKNRIVEAVYKEHRLLPVRGKSCSQLAMPFLKDKVPTFHDFAVRGLEDLYSPQRLKNAMRLDVTELNTGLLLNNGSGEFAWQPLPPIAQISPSFGVVLQDFDGDGCLDLALAQNFFSPQRETGRMDGGLGMILQGDGKGNFKPLWPKESGIVVPEDAKALTVTDIDRNRTPDIVFATNNGPLKVFTNSAPAETFFSVRLRGPQGNIDGIGSRVAIKTRHSREFVAEVYAGSGYLSQSPVPLVFGVPSEDHIDSVTVKWPDGSSTRVEQPGAAGVEIHYGD